MLICNQRGMSRQDLSPRRSQTHRATSVSQVRTRNYLSVLLASTRLTVTRPCCASASGRGGQPGANNSKDDIPLIQPSLVIPPPSRGSQYGRNRLLDVAFGGSGGDDDGGGVGGTGNGGAGWGGGGRGGGNGRSSNPGGQGGGSGGFFSGRRFGLLPRVLLIVQFLAWSTVLYMLVDTVLNTSNRVARKMWNGARGARTDRKSQLGTQNPDQSDPNQPDPNHASPKESAPSQSMASRAKGDGVEEDEGSTEEVVVIEEVVEEVVEPVATGPSAVNLAPPPATDMAATQISQSSTLDSIAQGNVEVVAPISRSGSTDAEAGGGGDGVTTAVTQPASDVGSVSASSAACSSTCAEGCQGVLGDLAASASASEEISLEQHQEQQHQAGQLGATSQTRPPFVRYEGARPVEYPTLTLFICILGGVGFFSMLG